MTGVLRRTRVITGIGRFFAFGLFLFLSLSLSFPAQAASAQQEPRSLSLFFGRLTDNVWQDLAFHQRDVDFVDSWLFGVGISQQLGREKSLSFGRLAFMFEPEVSGHFGVQDLWQVDFPVSARYSPPSGRLGHNTFSFGIGPSYASERPEVERQRGDGEAQNCLIFWKIELGHDIEGAPGSSVFMRLHHRSSGFGVMGESGSSNGLVVGFRSGF